MYKIEFAKRIRVDKIPKYSINEILKEIKKLSSNPRPNGVKKIKLTDWLRIRIGDYRVIYRVNDEHKTIFILDIDHRKDVYR